ncbi:hypothetical protein P5673_010420 [Acropora cervicornis]|uniref:Uncharacterized protein n=1 Tax=Acropora cervicornis TaxID=6130 RepID=A0AAD9QRC6_ACRCE|nr:hypothetical protein P5673_010420 [Acropora cervicornis]
MITKRSNRGKNVKRGRYLFNFGRTTNSPLQVIKLAFVGERASWRGWISNVSKFTCALLGVNGVRLLLTPSC